MTDNVNEALSAIHISFVTESEELKGKLQHNKSRINELDHYINNLKVNKEESDESLFSPHKAIKDSFESIKEDELIREKNSLLQINEQISKEIIILDERIKSIKEVISVDPFLNRFIFLDMQENERKRIARDLHDSSLQNLIHLIHSIELCTLFIDHDPQRSKLELESISQNIRMVIKEMRETIYDLRPMEFDDLGFREAIRNMTDKLQKETDIFITLDMDENISVKNELIYSNIYRIIRECISNAIKHSEAKEVNISLSEKENMFHVMIEDDGVGFDEVSFNGRMNKIEGMNHFGIQILKERVQLLKGVLKISSSGNKGTIIEINIPTDMK